MGLNSAMKSVAKLIGSVTTLVVGEAHRRPGEGIGLEDGIFLQSSLVRLWNGQVAHAADTVSDLE